VQVGIEGHAIENREGYDDFVRGGKNGDLDVCRRS